MDRGPRRRRLRGDRDPVGRGRPAGARRSGGARRAAGSVADLGPPLVGARRRRWRGQGGRGGASRTWVSHPARRAGRRAADARAPGVRGGLPRRGRLLDPRCSSAGGALAGSRARRAGRSDGGHRSGGADAGGRRWGRTGTPVARHAGGAGREWGRRRHRRGPGTGVGAGAGGRPRAPHGVGGPRRPRSRGKHRRMCRRKS